MATSDAAAPAATRFSPERTLAIRRMKAALRPLNESVAEIHYGLCDNQDYLRFFEAVYDEQAVEGSLAADNLSAARMLRERAKDLNIEAVAHSKLATLSKCLGVILRRDRMSRKDSRNTLDGVVVPGGDVGDL